MPFKLMFRVEVVIPMKIGLPIPRVENFHEKSNLDRLRIDLDLLEKIKEKAQIRMATYK